ncbi:MAG: serine/threonine protein kinase [Chloroflexota bacterium]
MPLSTGQILNNRYRIVSLLAQGGFGAVYRAWDLNLKAPVALKENMTHSPETTRQFMVEARLLANLRHENLPYVIDHFIMPDQGQYLVMEFVEGQDLWSMLQQTGGPLTEEQVLPWIKQVAQALAYLHAQVPPVIHRDIKPGNIKITPKGQAMLVDFGIAKLYDPSRQTTLGARAVTYGYSPPEQYGSGSTDARSDIYALGATLYAVLTGQTPTESMKRQLGTNMPAPRQLNPAISPNVEQAILRAMSLEPQRRFRTMKEFQDALSASIPATQVLQRPVETVAPLQTQASAQGQAAQKRSGPRYERTQLAPAPLQNPPMEGVRPDSWSQTSNKRARSSWMIGIFLVVCMALGLLVGAGIYTVFFPTDGLSTKDATATQFSRDVAATVTAIALANAQGASPQPSMTHTEPVPPTWTPVPLPTWTPALFPTSSPTSPPTATPIPSPTKTENPVATWLPCAGSYPSRLHINDRAYVSYDPPLPNRVRNQPGTSSEVLGILEVGEKMRIVDGPACSNGWVWWKVSSLDKSLVGWTAEGDAEAYWLVPLP